jgi:CubicO group peptidase (beta-lactamase class C family)
VQDENAFAAGGIEGHAGLFGDIRSVGRLLTCLMADYYGASARPLFRQDILQRFFTPRRRGGRPLGFDRPDAENSSSGRFFSREAIGHLGFTGTSFWVDLRRAVAVVLLTNRIHPTRENERIRGFRPLLHDAVMQALI